MSACVIPANEWRPDARDDSYALDAVRALVDSVREALDIESNDLTVSTTLDLTAQRAAQRAVQRRADAIESQGARDGVEGAMVAHRPAQRRRPRARRRTARTSAATSTACCARTASRGPRSSRSSTRRRCASGMSPATEVDDTPVEIAIGRTVWEPRNFGDEYLGRTTMRRALTKSANAATVRISRSVGEEKVVATAHRNGIVSALEPVPSLALGALEVTPMELVSAYAPFANGGFRVTPRLVTRIASVDGTVVWTSEPKREPAMDARDAFLLTSMLKSVVDEGTARAVRDYGVKDPVAGKTGTTNGGTDVWFVGYTPTVIAGFWFGYDEPRSMGRDASGGRLAAPAWAEFYVNGWKEQKGSDWQAPAGLLQRRIDASNGLLATEYCPWTRDEWFRAGTEPTDRCPEHVAPAEPEPVWQELPPQIGEKVEEVGKKAGSKLKRVLGKIFRW